MSRSAPQSLSVNDKLIDNNPADLYPKLLREAPFDPVKLELGPFFTKSRIIFLCQLVFYILAVPSLILFNVSLTWAAYADLIILGVLIVMFLSLCLCLKCDKSVSPQQEMVTLAWCRNMLALIPTTSIITWLGFLNAEFFVCAVSAVVSKMKYVAYNSCTSECYKSCMFITSIFVFILCGLFNIGLALIVIIMKLSQVNFVDIEMLQAVYTGEEYEWSFNHFFILIVVLYQFVNILPINRIQKQRVIEVQENLFGADFYEKKGNLYGWMILTMRSRGYGYLYICFYLAGMDYEGIENVLKLVVEHTPLYKDHVSIVIK